MPRSQPTRLAPPTAFLARLSAVLPLPSLPGLPGLRAGFIGPLAGFLIGALAGGSCIPSSHAQAPGDQSAPAHPAPERLLPRVRTEALPEPARVALPASRIDPFLRGLQVMESQALAQAPRVVAGASGQGLISRGDIAFARGTPGHPLTPGALPAGTGLWVLRPARPLRDPASGAVLGYETRRVAQARLVQAEDPAADIPRPAVIELTAAAEEVRPGDLLQAQAPDSTLSYEPHVPLMPVQARVLAVDSRGAMMAGPREGLIIDRGRLHGLEPGHLLSLRRAGRRSADRLTGDILQLPDESLGQALVVRVHERLSQALILHTRDGIRPGDELVGGP